MKKLYKLIQTITAATLLLIFAGCSQEILKSPSTGSGTSLSIENTSYTVSGSVSIDSSAYPKEFISQDTQNGRTATANFSESLWTCDIYAKKDETTIHATVTKTGTQYSYTLELPTKGTWNLWAKFFINNTSLLSNQVQITIPENAQTHYSIEKSFTVSRSPAIGTGKNGGINLKILNNSSNVSSITWDWIDKPQGVTDGTTKSVSGAGQSVFFDFDSIDSGIYKVKISFKDSTGKILYSCYENILVFFDFVTDTWYGPSPYINNSNEFVYDDSISAAYAQGIKHVDIPSGDPVYLLWSDFEYEPDSLFQSLPEQNEIGGQIFTSLTEDMTITDPIVDCGSNYCFDDTVLYVPPYRYVNTYAGFGKDPTFDLENNIYEFFNETPEAFPSKSMIIDGYLYFLFAIDNYSSSDYFLGRYGINDNSIAFTEVNLNTTPDSICTSFTVKHLSGTNSGILYYAIEASSTVLYRQPFEITENAGYTFIHFNDDGSYKQANHHLNAFEKDNQLETYSLTKSLSVSDMLIVDDYLYVLVYLSGIYEEYFTKEQDESYKLVEDNYLSTGGIIKFNESNSQIQQAVFAKDTKWTNQNTMSTDYKVLGLYTYPNDVTYYKYSAKNGYEKINETVSYEDEDDTFYYYYYVPTQPPLESNGPSIQYLYGPRKFLSASATELVFIDDGGYIADPVAEGAQPRCLPVNRIATLNLATETFTFVNVNATFSAAYSQYTHSFTTNPIPGGIIIPDPGPGKP